MDWQLVSSLLGNVAALIGFLGRWRSDRAPSVTIRETEYSPYPRFEADHGQEPTVQNRFYLELELSNSSRKLSLDSYEILFSFGSHATIEQSEAQSKSSLRPVELVQQTPQSRRYRVFNFEPGDLVAFRFRLANVSTHKLSVDGYARGVRLRKIQLKNGMTLD